MATQNTDSEPIRPIRTTIRIEHENGAFECAVTKPTDGGETEDGTPIIKFKSTLVEDFDREEFDEVADPPDDMGLVRLLDPERTPFGALEGTEVTA